MDIRTFWTHTNTTALYWDVIANIEVAVTVGSGGSDQAEKQTSFACKTTQRTYVWPSLELVSEVLDACLVELMAKVGADAIWDAT
jgi:hypothetical protein